jgi:chlorobactene glucosyltransferase
MAFHPFSILALLQSHPKIVKRLRISRESLSSLGVANGQFLLFAREAYLSLGGHAAIRDHLVEDIAFGRRVAGRTGEGMKIVNADGMDLLQCRMYVGLKELWEGFSKNLRPVFEESHVGFFLFICVTLAIYLLPFFLLSSGHGIGLLSFASVSIIFLTRMLLTIRFRSAWLGLIGHPLGVALSILIALNSWRLCLTKTVKWKGRNYSGVTRSSLK